MFIHFPFQMDTQASFIKAKISKSVFLAFIPLPLLCLLLFPLQASPSLCLSFLSFLKLLPSKVKFPKMKTTGDSGGVENPGVSHPVNHRNQETWFCTWAWVLSLSASSSNTSSVHLLIHLHNELSNTQALRKQAIQGEEIRLLIQAKEAPR